MNIKVNNVFREVTGLPDSKENNNFTVIFMQENMMQFDSLSLFVPAHAKVKDLIFFLTLKQCTPWNHFFLTNKLKEKPQFTLEKELKDIRDQCKKDRQGNYVLLCYQEKKDSAQAALTQKENLPSVLQPPPEPKKDKEDDGGCSIM